MLVRARERIWVTVHQFCWPPRNITSEPKCKLLRSQAPQAAASKIYSQVPPRKIWKVGIFACFFYPEPRVIAIGKYLHAYLTTAFLFAIVLWDSDKQTFLVLQVGDLGSQLSGGRAWGATCMDKLLPEGSWKLGFIVEASQRENTIVLLRLV